jgi:DNA-binding IclR family transcriptional regulator
VRYAEPGRGSQTLEVFGVKKSTKLVSAAKKTAAYATPALEKGLDILELLAHERDGLTKSEMARALDRTVSEIFRMLVCLERRRYISQTGADRYVLSLRLFQLVQEHPPTERLLSEALPRMHVLVERLQQSCHLGVLEAGRVVILAQTSGSGPVGFYVKAGSIVDLMEAATGQAILAYLPPEAYHRVLQDWIKETGRKVPADLRGRLMRIRRRGYEKRDSYQVRGILNISCPICDAQGRAVAALTVPYIQRLHDKVDIKQVELAIVAAAKEISAAIGAQ